MTGKQLRGIRQRLALTQQELADQLGVARNTVARWERDEVAMRLSVVKLIEMFVKMNKLGGKP